MDLRNNYDEKKNVIDGTLYRKANVVQVWWNKNVHGEPFIDENNGKETWTTLDIKNAKENFMDMWCRWS